MLVPAVSEMLPPALTDLLPPTSSELIAPTATITATKAIVMTTLQKAIIGATLAAAVGTGIYATYEARQASTRRAEVQTLQQQQRPLVEQIQHLQRERDDATNRLASLTDENAALKRNPTEVLT